MAKRAEQCNECPLRNACDGVLDPTVSRLAQQACTSNLVHAYNVLGRDTLNLPQLDPCEQNRNSTPVLQDSVRALAEIAVKSGVAEYIEEPAATAVRYVNQQNAY